MPIIHLQHEHLTRQNAPEGCPFTALGIFRVSQVDGRFDEHFHDCDEYWLIYRGRALISSEGELYEVGPGDIVFTRAGDQHDVVEVSEDLEAFYLEDRLVDGGRVGHLHRTPGQSAGHPVRDGAAR